MFFFSSRRRHTRFDCDWSSDVCSSDLKLHLPKSTLQRGALANNFLEVEFAANLFFEIQLLNRQLVLQRVNLLERQRILHGNRDRKSTRLNSSHSQISYAVFCLKKKKTC